MSIMTNSLLSPGICLNKIQVEQIRSIFKDQYFMLVVVWFFFFVCLYEVVQKNKTYELHGSKALKYFGLQKTYLNALHR